MATTTDSRTFLTLITDDSLAPDRTIAIVEATCAIAPITVQLRARHWSGREIWATAERLRAATRRTRSRFAVHDRLDVAIAVEADAAHLPATGIDAAAARALLDRHCGARIELGASVHSKAEIEALAGVVDYVHFGPTFATDSKRPFGPPQGVAALGAAVALAHSLDPPMRVIAVGGVTARNAETVFATGADGVALIGAVMRAKDPAAALGDLVAAIRRARA